MYALKTLTDFGLAFLITTPLVPMCNTYAQWQPYIPVDRNTEKPLFNCSTDW